MCQTLLCALEIYQEQNKLGPALKQATIHAKQNKLQYIMCHGKPSILKAGSGRGGAGGGVSVPVGLSREASLGRGPVK